ncbi:FHA domain-containing protein [Gloeocapsa sp. PCC 73106]|uniref:FHA domain-containing protein n=1 Tax=Gloeocapsa sp. PCC 73106 TaxID=102232 RepID=UPI0002AC09F9|nr:FHA domain-containing protein [Gloeocapsa sp. PCC 73106]ELR97878.1 FHA domain-containing protein [Gloeocapsa sp. PCC 73106]
MKAYLEQISSPLGREPIKQTLSEHNTLIMGRDPSKCQIVLDSNYYQGVSKVHSEISLKQSGWEINDLGSSNGTYINGRRVQGPQSLRSGDRIQLGEQGPEFIFTLETGINPPQSYVPPTMLHPPTQHSVVPVAPSSGNGGLWVKIVGGLLISVGILYVVTRIPTQQRAAQTPPVPESQPEEAAPRPPVSESQPEEAAPRPPVSESQPSNGTLLLEEYFNIYPDQIKKESVTVDGIDYIAILLPVEAKSSFDANITPLGTRYYDQNNQPLGLTLPIVFNPESFQPRDQGLAVIFVPVEISEKLKTIEVVKY